MLKLSKASKSAVRCWCSSQTSADPAYLCGIDMYPYFGVVLQNLRNFVKPVDSTGSCSA